MFLANFQTHFSTNSATLASCDSGKVPLEGKGLTICKSRAKRDLAQAMVNDFMIKKYEHSAHRKIDILRPVANSRKIIILMNRDKSFTFVMLLSSVSSNRRVSSSKSDVRISTVSDSARNA
jgi:hypothetical protein